MTTAPRFSAAGTLRAIAGAGRTLGRRQNRDGHRVFELEADATIPAEYVLLKHDMDRITPERQARIGADLRRIQGERGGWPMFRAGAFNLSARVKAYCALKAIGDASEAPHMIRARQRLHPHPARPVRRHCRARRAGDAGRDHAPAQVVLLQHLGHVVPTCGPSRSATRAGSGAGAPTTLTAPGRFSAA